MLIDGISGTISVSCALGRDVHHWMFCPLIFVVSENEHRQAVTAVARRIFLAAGNKSEARQFASVQRLKRR
jgi:hypothetical protein